jgi:hypothetical protein
MGDAMSASGTSRNFAATQNLVGIGGIADMPGIADGLPGRA